MLQETDRYFSLKGENTAHLVRRHDLERVEPYTDERFIYTYCGKRINQYHEGGDWGPKEKVFWKEEITLCEKCQGRHEDSEEWKEELRRISEWAVLLKEKHAKLKMKNQK